MLLAEEYEHPAVFDLDQDNSVEKVDLKLKELVRADRRGGWRVTCAQRPRRHLLKMNEVYSEGQINCFLNI